jgi:hypothetical protein
MTSVETSAKNDQRSAARPAFRLERMCQPLIRLGMEPPFRILVKALLKRLPVSVTVRATWEVCPRPAYLLGLVTAAQQAQRQRIPEIAVIEFGVAGGEGLVALQGEAEMVEAELGVGIKVYGFDMGSAGLPALIGDYRDHPDRWRPGDFPMDEAALRRRLTDRTTLILGNVRDTVSGFFERFQPPPIGFMAVDVDLYSSTSDVLRILTLPGMRMLWHVPVYFDDIDSLVNHEWGGQLLAIREFNNRNRHIKIDRWYGVKAGRPFPERPYLEQLYVAHDLDAISNVAVDREIRDAPLRS